MAEESQSICGETASLLEVEAEQTPSPGSHGTWSGSPPELGIKSREGAVEPTRSPPFTTVIRKTSVLGCLGIILGGLLWCIMHTVRSIQQWQPPLGEDVDPFCWPVVKSYLFLAAQLSVFVTVTLFAFTIPTLVMTWITALVMEYLFGFRVGRRGQKRLIESARGWAKEMSWSTFKSAMQEGKVFGGAAFLTLCLLPWVLGTSHIFAGQTCPSSDSSHGSLSSRPCS